MTSKQNLGALGPPNPQTPHEHRFFKELSEFLDVVIVPQKPVHLRRYIDGVILADERQLPVFRELGIDTRNRSIYMEHLSSSLTKRAIERFRNLMQEIFASNQPCAGLMFCRHMPRKLLVKVLIKPSDIEGAYEFSAGLNDNPELQLMAVVPHLLPVSRHYDHLKLAMAQDPHEFATIAERLYGAKPTKSFITREEIAEMSAKALAETEQTDSETIGLASYARTVSLFLRRAREGHPWYQDFLPVLREFDERAEQERHRAEQERHRAEQESRRYTLSLAEDLAPEIYDKLSEIEDIEELRAALREHLKAKR